MHPQDQTKGSSQWCEKHWAAIRDSEEINGLQASLMLMQMFIDDPLTQRRTGGDVAQLNKVMAELSPLCCYYGDKRMRELYEACRMPPPAEAKSEDNEQCP